mmetsp:Transcript_12105/g.48736  ORF Transcript_12105/g.48736 Transcript_12105/m.48736 type:complete len:115 (-) Transcript_12105:422-766(-)
MSVVVPRGLATSEREPLSCGARGPQVNIFAVPPNYGTKGGSLGRKILTMLGFSSFTIKAHGRRSPASYVRATFDALEQLTPIEDMARARGRRILELEAPIKEQLKWPPGYREYE